MSKKDTEKARASLVKKLPTVYCDKCKTHYASNIKDIAKRHKNGNCIK